MESRSLWVLAALSVAVATASPAHVAAQREARQQQEFRWSGRLEAGRQLEIRGLNGGITAERATGSEVEIVAVKSSRRSDPASVSIEVIPHGDGITVCTLYPTPSNANRPNQCGPGSSSQSVRDNDVSVEYTVRVPSGVHLVARTTNGQVDAYGLTGDVDASTTNGGIVVSTTGLARARTTNGSIDVTLGSTRGTDDLEFRTTNGSITVNVPAGINATLEAGTTNGSLRSDFPITVQGTFGPRRLEGTLGSGGRRIVLQTTNGDVQIRRAGG